MPSLVHRCALWLFLSLSALKLASSAPASNLLQPALFVPHSTNSSSFPDASAFLALPSDATASVGGIEHWTYVIPHTTLMLRMGAYPPHKIDRAALGRTILAAQVRVRAHLKKHGDGELWEGDDRKFTPSTATLSNHSRSKHKSPPLLHKEKLWYLEAFPSTSHYLPILRFWFPSPSPFSPLAPHRNTPN